MSQSPLDEESEDEALSYQQGWRALNRLLHEGRSFSGGEKNSAFLNPGPGADGQARPFADVSSAIGFAFPDDGRGLALADWDFDGDLDVWTTNRTAPRLRLLRNNNATGNHFLAIQLRANGKTSNRDAIGARVSLHLAGESVPRIRTLHAGHGFLSQSSGWLHFGLGAGATIEKLVVQWPAGKREEIRGLEPDRFFLVHQGEPLASAWTPPPNRAKLTASTPSVEPGSAETRVVVPPGMLMPALRIQSSDGATRPFQRSGEGLFLVNLWASYCLPCQKELRDWAADAAKLREAGIEVLALNTDGADGLADAQRVIRDTGFPFPWAQAAPSTVGSLDILHDAVLDLWTPLPVPSSFLVNAEGEVIAIYTGPVEASRLVADAKLATATPEQRRNASVPFPGLWIGAPTNADSIRVASQMVDRDEIQLAVDYLANLVDFRLPRVKSEADRRDLGDAHYMLGLLLGQSKRPDEAMHHLEAAAQLLPDDQRVAGELQRLAAQRSPDTDRLAQLQASVAADPDNIPLREELGSQHIRLGQFAEAAEQLALVVEKDPTRAVARFHLANALMESGRPEDAIAQYKQTLSTDGRLLDAANCLAWVLAAHPDESLRAPQESLALATRLCAMTKNETPRFLDTLATAQAANGHFEAATTAATQALALYRADPAHAADAASLAERMKLFEAGQPYLEERWANAP